MPVLVLPCSLATKKREDLVVDLDVWSASGYPPAVSTCVIACCKGVKRAHLLDARIDGGLLLELYSRDGVGTMISADFYEGIRRAGPADVDAIRGLLKPLEDAGGTCCFGSDSCNPPLPRPATPSCTRNEAPPDASQRQKITAIAGKAGRPTSSLA
jgi:hypothetical protein